MSIPREKDPEEAQLKADMARLICKIYRARGWSQNDAATALGVTQNKISDLERGKLNGVSVTKLMHYLTLLDHNIRLIAEENSPRKLGALTFHHLPSTAKKK